MRGNVNVDLSPCRDLNGEGRGWRQIRIKAQHEGEETRLEQGNNSS